MFHQKCAFKNAPLNTPLKDNMSHSRLLLHTHTNTHTRDLSKVPKHVNSVLNRTSMEGIV